MPRSIRPLVLTSLAAAVAALSLTACTSPQGDAGAPTASASAEPTSSATASAEPTGSATAGGSGTADASGITNLPDGVTFVRGLPDGTDQPADAVAGVGWSSDGTQLFVTTFGSSTCPLVATGLEADGTGVTVELTQAGGAVCTMDLAPATTTLDAPSGVSTTAETPVTIGELGSASVPAAASPVAMGWIVSTG